MRKILPMLIFICFFSTGVYGQSFQNPQGYKYNIAACLMFQNEAFYLKEWIEYHKMIGIKHFYLFNNGSTDNYLDVLKPYICSGLVELYHYPFIGANQKEHNEIQCWIYSYALKVACGKAKWLAIIDADEFIVPIREKPLVDILNCYEEFGGLYLNYLMFGTSHIEKIPPNQLIIETLNHCAATPIAFGKSIVRPERVCCCTDPHRMEYHYPFIHVDTQFRWFDWTPPDVADDVLLLHHYYLGDIHHAVHVKFPRRRKWEGIELGTYLESMEWTNARLNDSMQRFVPRLRKRMKCH